MDLRRKIYTILTVTAIVVLIDQLVKIWVVSNFPGNIPVKIIDNFFRITLIFNPNTAFGISLGEGFPYTIIASGISLVVLILALMEKRIWNIVAYSMILGGAIGNILDRVLRGEVVDFIDIGISDNLRWYVFNGADVFITIGILMLLADSLMGHMKEKKTGSTL